MIDLRCGDCLDVIGTIPDNSIDSVVTDPPYGLSKHTEQDARDCLSAWLRGDPYLTRKKGFMSKSWDSWVPGPEVWTEVYRVLKPGAHILCFAGTRSMDLMCMALRLSGFELRDSIGYAHDGNGAPLCSWVYGSGFPKGQNVSKAIDKRLGCERDVIGIKKKEQSFGYTGNNCYGNGPDKKGVMKITAPSSPEAKQWDGWNSALKPAWEPIILARKPLDGTLVDNVLKHGVGGINVDGCRITDGTETGGEKPEYTPNNKNKVFGVGKCGGAWENTQGRYPANLIHDGSDSVLECFPETKASTSRRGKRSGESAGCLGEYTGQDDVVMGHNDNGGSASRFFYCAKASKKDRGEGNNHPTVKPQALMRYLCRLITPPNGTVLDPFAGSGSTLMAAKEEGFGAIGIELNEEYFEIAKKRIEEA